MVSDEVPYAGVARDQEVRDAQDSMSSEPSLWLPKNVVRRDRQRATAIWIVLLAAFLAYIIYVFVDSYDARKNPAASVMIKQQYYTFPDMVFCVTVGMGCYAEGDACFKSSYASFHVDRQWGFLDANIALDQNGMDFEAAHPNCKVVPLSQLPVNETGVENGDIDYFGARILGTWYEDGEGEPHATNINSRFVTLYFADMDAGEDALKGIMQGSKLPYTLAIRTTNEAFILAHSHMMMSMTQFTPIGSDGKPQDTQTTYTQTTTNGYMAWNWTESSHELESACMAVDIWIPIFQYEHMEEVDPLDAWTIIGAIGGVWQIVSVIFGLFFVFSEKQTPGLKMRNFRKTMNKSMGPIRIVRDRLPAAGFRKCEDAQIDASEEDIPEHWIKRKRPDGALYYFNILTGVCQAHSPNDLDSNGNTSSAEVSKGNGGSNVGALPPGWVAKRDNEGNIYYVDTVLKTTRSNRPLQKEPITKVPLTQASRGIVEMVDAPIVQTYRRKPMIHKQSAQRQFGKTPPSSLSAAQSATFHQPVLVAVGSSHSNIQASSSDGHLTSSVSTKSRQVLPEEDSDGENTCAVDISTQSSSSSYMLSASSHGNTGQGTRGHDSFSISSSLRESQTKGGRRSFVKHPIKVAECHAPKV